MLSLLADWTSTVMVANPARDELNGGTKKNWFPRDRFCRPVPRHPGHSAHPHWNKFCESSECGNLSVDKGPFPPLISSAISSKHCEAKVCHVLLKFIAGLVRSFLYSALRLLRSSKGAHPSRTSGNSSIAPRLRTDSVLLRFISY